MILNDYTNKVLNGENLLREEMYAAANYIFNHLDQEDEIKRFLISLHHKGETAEELVGIVDYIMEHCNKIDATPDCYFDNCGTGGDKLGTFNISTTAAFVLAGCGIKVAKHGNRKISSLSGSSDVLEQLNIAIDQTADQIKEQLDEIGLAFIHAPNFHPLLGKIREIRNTIPHATIFNLTGPLCNPIHLESQIVGISRKELLKEYIQALKILGRKRAIVVCGPKGIDEAALFGETSIAFLKDGEISYDTISTLPNLLNKHDLTAIIGGDAAYNAKIVESVLQGEKGAYADTVIFNAALALVSFGKVDNLLDGIKMAKHAITSGEALNKLRQIQKYHSKEVSA